MLLMLADYLLEAAHLAVIAVNLFGWWWRSTLRAAQVVLGITLVSWFGFGLVHGFGYCFLTDWHWQVKAKLGATNLPDSYIKYLIDGITGGDVPAAPVEVLTVVVTLAAVVGCLIQSWRFRRVG